VTTAEAARTDRTTIEFPAAEGFRSVGRLVLGGIASRFELPVDRVDDLLLAVESLLLQDPIGDTIRLEAEASATGLLVRIGPFAPERLEDPGVRRILTRLVDEVGERTDGSRQSASVELLVTAPYRGGAHG
jgi:hypothetical protein